MDWRRHISHLLSILDLQGRFYTSCTVCSAYAYFLLGGFCKSYNNLLGFAFRLDYSRWSRTFFSLEYDERSFEPWIWCSYRRERDRTTSRTKELGWGRALMTSTFRRGSMKRHLIWKNLWNWQWNFKNWKKSFIEIMTVNFVKHPPLSRPRSWILLQVTWQPKAVNTNQTNCLFCYRTECFLIITDDNLQITLHKQESLIYDGPERSW
jgi:hypothetical protein